MVHYGTYGSDGMRRDGPPGGAYSAVYEQYPHARAWTSTPATKPAG